MFFLVVTVCVGRVLTAWEERNQEGDRPSYPIGGLGVTRGFRYRVWPGFIRGLGVALEARHDGACVVADHVQVGGYGTVRVR